MDQTSRIDYHSGFAGGMEFFLRKYLHSLTIEREHYLSKEPLRMDLLIVKKDPMLRMEDPFTEFFRIYNVIEYRN